MSDAEVQTAPTAAGPALAGEDVLRQLVQVAPQIVASLQGKPPPRRGGYVAADCFDAALRKLLAELHDAVLARRTPGGILADCRTALNGLLDFAEAAFPPARRRPLLPDVEAMLPDQYRTPATIGLAAVAGLAAIFIVSGLYMNLRALIEAGGPVGPLDLILIRPVDLLAILVLLAALAGAWRMTAPVAADPMARLRRLVDRRQIGETFEMQAANLPLGAAAGAGWETDEGAETFVRFVHGLAHALASQAEMRSVLDGAGYLPQAAAD